MPFGDGTGPRGLGPMTGGGFGRCAGAWSGDFCGRPGAFGYGRGGDRRRARRWMGTPGWTGVRKDRFGDPRFSQWTPQDELSYLKEYVLGLEEALSAAKARMDEIEKAGKID